MKVKYKNGNSIVKNLKMINNKSYRLKKMRNKNYKSQLMNWNNNYKKDKKTKINKLQMKMY